MNYLSVNETAKVWQVSERTVRDYCSKDLVSGAYKDGKQWKIPEDSVNPKLFCSSLIKRLKDERESNISGGIYCRTQVDFAFNSNHIEGGMLSHDQTRLIFETNTIGFGQSVKLDDVIEVANHFRCFDFIIDTYNHELTENYIKTLHLYLKNGTVDSRKRWFSVGNYKRLPNTIADRETTVPEAVEKEMKELLKSYKVKEHDLKELLDFHVCFERIHPFQDGNGRVGRLILFKECLRFGIVPFIISEELKYYYYRGLSNWGKVNEFLTDTVLTAQDNYKDLMAMFRINGVLER